MNSQFNTQASNSPAFNTRMKTDGNARTSETPDDVKSNRKRVDPVFRSDILRLEVWLEEQLGELGAIPDETTRSDLEFQAYRKYMEALSQTDHPYADLLKRIQGCYECFLASNFNSSTELDNALLLSVEKEKEKARLIKELANLEVLQAEITETRDKLLSGVQALGAQIKEMKQ